MTVLVSVWRSNSQNKRKISAQFPEDPHWSCTNKEMLKNYYLFLKGLRNLGYDWNLYKLCWTYFGVWLESLELKLPFCLWKTKSNEICNRPTVMKKGYVSFVLQYVKFLTINTVVNYNIFEWIPMIETTSSSIIKIFCKPIAITIAPASSLTITVTNILIVIISLILVINAKSLFGEHITRTPALRYILPSLAPSFCVVVSITQISPCNISLFVVVR